MMYRVIVCLLLLGVVTAGQAQTTPPFYNEIQAFKKQDSLHMPPKHAILFVGSSSFRLWTDMQDYFPGYTVINRGFGGSTLPDVIRYTPDIIYPYDPKQIVIFCGENDVAALGEHSADTVVAHFKTLFNLIRKKWHNMPIVYVSLKPSPSRWRLRADMESVNNQVRDFLKTQKQAVFVDVYHKMLKPDGTPMTELFKPDMLHMNPKGYAIWKEQLQPYLIKG